MVIHVSISRVDAPIGRGYSIYEVSRKKVQATSQSHADATISSTKVPFALLQGTGLVLSTWPPET